MRPASVGLMVLALSAAVACSLTPGVGGNQAPSGFVATEKGKIALAKGEWPYWGGDPQTTRYSPLTQINRSNLDKLEIAWRWTIDGSGEQVNAKISPLMADGVLYIPWLAHGAAAIDAATGKTLWTFEPPKQPGGRAPSLASRSLAYWSDGANKRLYHNSLDGRLIAIDAKTGKLDVSFGKNGWVDLRDGIVEPGSGGGVSSVSPALVVGDVVVASVIPAGGRGKKQVQGAIRGYDVRTGKLLWTHWPIPKKGEPGYDTWENGSAEYTGHAGTWTMMAADPETGYLYIPHETPTNEFYGGQRLGDGLYGEALVCLDTKTGKLVWYFQTVHHGVWDYDLPSAPILHEVVKDGKRIKAVTQMTKQSLLFTFDRVTGKPVWPIEERPVPKSTIPGERLSPTQPFPTLPEPLMKTGYDENELIDFTPELRAEAKQIASQYTKGELYTPPTEITPTNKGTWMYPGTGGGPNWNGSSVDPATNIMYTPIRRKPQVAGLRKGDPATTDMDYYGGGGGGPITGPQGLPILKPPYSEIVATDMNTGKQLWRVPLGGANDFIRNHPALKGLNLDFDKMGQFDVRPAPLLTPDVLFLGEGANLSSATGGPMLRAYDKTNGAVIWQKAMPTVITAGPISYMAGGKQYLVVTVSDRGKPAELVALAVGDGVDDARVAKASAAPAGALSAPRPRIEMTAAEVTMGRDGYAKACAFCHGPDGRGLPNGGAPSLVTQVDVAEIARVINAGQGEMPSMAAALRPEEVQAVAKFVAAGMRAPGNDPGAPGAPAGARGAGSGDDPTRN